MTDLILQNRPRRVKLPLAAMPGKIVIAIPEMPLGYSPFPLRVRDEALKQVRLPKDGFLTRGIGARRFLSEAPKRVSAPPRPD